MTEGFDRNGIPPKIRELLEAGEIKQAEAVPDVTGEVPTKDEFNGLLASLRAAGILKTG